MPQEIDLVACLLEFAPGAEWKIDNNDYASLEWYSDSEKPSLKDLESAWPKVLEKRQAELDKLANQAQAKEVLLARLGITAEEAQLLLA